MDWTADHIYQWQNLEPAVEQMAIQLRRNSNRYTTFARIAFCSYRNASYQDKIRIIPQVMGVHEFPDDILARDVINTCWHQMPDEVKNAWNARSEHINSLPCVGEFCTLPCPLVGLLDKVLRDLVRREVD